MVVTGEAASGNGVGGNARLVAWRLIRKAGRQVRKGLVGEPAQPEPIGFEQAREASPEVVVYFPDPPSKFYQLAQWLPVLEELAERHRVLIVTRRKGSFERLDGCTTLAKAHAPWFRHLSELYDQIDFKVALYVNNGTRNFQSLAHQAMLHVHINHGESDKICMVSNQVKAYDRVLVAGEAALQRHQAALINFDQNKLVPVGRPQLDHVPASSLPTSERRTIVYAPTWEGENEANNYTSVDVYGAEIVSTVLAQPNVRLIYKPHPRIAHSTDESVREGHARIVELIESAQAADEQAGHRVLLEGDMLALLTCCDQLITDVSSVALDFLYLSPDKPMFITDRRNDRELLERDSPVTRSSHIIDRSTLSTLGRTLTAEPTRATLQDDRQRMRTFYFGDGEVGESTERFVKTVSELIDERDALRTEQARLSHVASHGITDD